VGHRDGRNLVGDRQRPGQDLSLGLALGIGVDDGREVGAALPKK